MEDWICFDFSIYDTILGLLYQCRYGKYPIFTGLLVWIILYGWSVNVPYDITLLSQVSYSGSWYSNLYIVTISLTCGWILQGYG